MNRKKINGLPELLFTEQQTLIYRHKAPFMLQYTTVRNCRGAAQEQQHLRLKETEPKVKHNFVFLRERSRRSPPSRLHENVHIYSDFNAHTEVMIIFSPKDAITLLYLLLAVNYLLIFINVKDI